jgi:type IV secretory pathway VirB4 component
MNPIFNCEGNLITSKEGINSSFIELIPPDSDGLDFDSLEQVLRDLEVDLINTDGEYKLYFKDGRIFFNCFSEINFSHGTVSPRDNAIGLILGRDNSPLNFYENYLTHENEFIRLLSFKELPSSIKALDVLSWPEFVICFKKVQTLEAKRKINFKRKLHYSSLFKGIRDLVSENAYEQAESLLEGITADNKALFQAETYLVLRALSKKALDEVTKKVIYEFKGQNAELFTEERGLSYLFQSIIPGIPSSFKRKLDLPSDYLSYMIPFHRDEVMNDGLKLNSRSGNEVFVDLFNPQVPNYNVLITGTSGQGKSVLANQILKFELERGHKAIVLDLGNSFNKNAMYHDGVLLSLKFNPFQFKDPRYLKEFVLAVIDEKFAKRDEGKLFEIISQLVTDSNVSTFNQLVLALDSEFPGIRYYFKEIEEYFTDEIQPINQFSYCNFDIYPDALKAPLIIYLIEIFKNLEGKKIFIFDECWHLLSKNANYIAECFRTFRKHHASAVAISQNMDDFSESSLGRVIIQNTYFKFLFKQSLKESEFLDSHAKKLLDSVHSKKGEYSEFLLLTENHKKPLRFYPNPLEYELFTTDRSDIMQFDYYMHEKGKFLPFKESIVNFTKIKNPSFEFQGSENE